MSLSPVSRMKLRHTLATQIAVVAALYATLVAGILLGQYLTRCPDVPTETPEIMALKSRLAEQPQSETIKTTIRNLDLELRENYFTDRAFVSFGGALLVLSVVVFLVSAKIALAARKKLPYPETVEITVDRESKEFAAARVGVIAAALVLIVGTISVVIFAERHMGGLRKAVQVAMAQVEEMPTKDVAATGSTPTDGTTAEQGETSEAEPATAEAVASSEVSETSQIAPKAAAKKPPTREEWAAAWPRFRGPDGSGHSAFANVPTTWDVEAEKNVLWKTEVPLPGNSSPIVWKDRLFLTGADEKRREVFCFDTVSGKLLWQKEIPGTPESTAKVPEVLEDTGFAAPSPTTDGRRVYASFANGDVGALDFEGNLVWSRSLGIPENTYGYATSLVVQDARLLVQFDQASANDGKSRLFALDVLTGKTLWEVKREVPNSWATPLVVETADGQSQIITTADPWVIAYDVADGREIWRVKCLSGDQGISPVIADGLLQIGNEYCQWQAIRLEEGMKGELPETSIVWTGDDGLPDTVSPVVVDGLLLLTTSSGIVTCYDAASGEMLWEEEFDAEFTSSPGVVGKRAYYIAKEGIGWVLEPTREGCTRVNETNLGEPCVTSPAFQDGRIYLRGETHVFCLGEK